MTYIRDIKNWKDPRTNNIDVQDLFSFFDELLIQILQDKELEIGWVLTLGSRQSGKTFSILKFLQKALLATKEQSVSYIVRKKENQLKRMKKQIFDDFKTDYNWTIKQGKDFKGEPNNTLTFNNNHMVFQTLNDEKVKIEDGGQVGGTTWSKAKYLFTFFEEVSQLKRNMVDNLMDTIRGGSDTQKINFFASNPWDTSHWYVQEFEEHLPADQVILEKQGYQFKIVDNYLNGKKAIFIRNNVITNKHIKKEVIKKLQSYKKYDENAYKISYLGMSGVLHNTLYAHNMKKMMDIDYNFINNKAVGELVGAVDWGEGKSKGASPTTMHFGKMDDALGCSVFGEKTHWNNGDGNKRAAVGLSQLEQFDMIIDFYLGYWKEYQQQIIVRIDNGSSIDMNEMINRRMWDTWGIHPQQIYFLPADKSVDIGDRVLSINMLIATGKYRIDKSKCPMLYQALMQAKRIEPKEVKENSKLERDPTWIHWINSGAEYILGNNLSNWMRSYSEIFQER